MLDRDEVTPVVGWVAVPNLALTYEGWAPVQETQPELMVKPAVV